MTSLLLCIACSFDKCGEREKIVLQNFFFLLHDWVMVEILLSFSTFSSFSS
jgi:hypothetical protein